MITVSVAGTQCMEEDSDERSRAGQRLDMAGSYMGTQEEKTRKERKEAERKKLENQYGIILSVIT